VRLRRLLRRNGLRVAHVGRVDQRATPASLASDVESAASRLEATRASSKLPRVVVVGGVTQPLTTRLEMSIAAHRFHR
jgi:hypothetical protein